MDQLEAHVIPDSNAVLLFLGGSFFRPCRVLYGTPANGAIVTLISDQQEDMTRKHTLPSSDMYGNALVRSLYNIPVCLSANAPKQKTLPIELLSSSMTYGPCSSSPTCNDGTERSSNQLLSSTIGAACTGGTCRSNGGCQGCGFVMLQIP